MLSDQITELEETLKELKHENMHLEARIKTFENESIKLSSIFSPQKNPC